MEEFMPTELFFFITTTPGKLKQQFRETANQVKMTYGRSFWRIKINLLKYLIIHLSLHVLIYHNDAQNHLNPAHPLTLADEQLIHNSL